MRHIIPISGKDSLATALVQMGREPDLDYEFVFNPTGLELPDVFEWMERVSKFLGKEVVHVSQPLKDIIVGYNYYLPSRQARYCTRKSKIEPFVKWLGKEPAMVYYGIRADEDRDGFDNAKYRHLTPVYPLKEVGYGISDVYKLVTESGLKPPTYYWGRLHEAVTKRLGYDPRGKVSEWTFDMLFAGRSRSNCDRCFNQRQYEWVWLSEAYPERYAEAMEWEKLGSEGGHTWADNYSLEEFLMLAPRIFKDRVDVVARYIHSRLAVTLFDADALERFDDTLAAASCGLFCGK
jgi:hypothetical protein